MSTIGLIVSDTRSRMGRPATEAPRTRVAPAPAGSQCTSAWWRAWQECDKDTGKPPTGEKHAGSVWWYGKNHVYMAPLQTWCMNGRCGYTVGVLDRTAKSRMVCGRRVVHMWPLRGNVAAALNLVVSAGHDQPDILPQF